MMKCVVVPVSASVEDETEKRLVCNSPLSATIDHFANGVVVPRPTLPVFVTVNSVVVALAVDDAIAKSVVREPVAPGSVATESCANGVVVPIPTFEAK
jgi:hypothetical protein